MTPPTTPPEIHTCTLHYTKNTHQDLDKPGISSVWIIYLQTHTTWHVINFHEQAILESRLSSANLSRASRRAIYDFQLRELDAAPRILERCVDSDNGEARITKRVKEFGRVEESIGMRRLLREFGEMMRMQEIPVDELYIPPLFLLWLESLNLKPPKTKKTNPKTKPHNPPETPLSSDHNKPVPQTPPHHPNFKIAIQVQKFDTGNVQETWIWNETRALLKQTNHSGPNKSGLYIIPNPYPSPPPPPSSPSPSTLVLFAWTHGSLTTENNKLYAQGRCFTFSPPAPHSNIPPPVHLHPVSNKSSTPSPHFAATINLSHFSNQWEDYKVDVNQPAIPCMWWKDNITILDDGVLLREYEELYESSKRKGGPHFTLSTFLAQIFHTINTTIPPSKKRANKNKSPNDDIDIPELYERGRQDLARSKRNLNLSPHEPKPPEIEAEKQTEAQTKAQQSTEFPPPPKNELTTKIFQPDPDPDCNPAIHPNLDAPPNPRMN